MELAVGDRIIVLVDMDCFYVQVEQKINPGFENKPCTVSQYNTWQGGGVIAVNYEARAFGVKRGMRGEQAKKLCPEIHNFFVPEVRGKADLTRYRDAGASVIEVLCEFSDCVERASVDEAYLDMTSLVSNKLEKDFSVNVDQLQNTFVVGWNKDKDGDDVKGWLDSINEDHTLNEQKLAIAAAVVEEMRAAVFTKTIFRCSAGIAHNKILAKLACGLNKPNKQTIVPHSSVPLLYKKLPINKVRNLGGKFGEEVKKKLRAETMADLLKYSETELCSNFGEKNGSWLYSISRGIEHEPVISRQLPKSIGCGKNFPGKGKLDTLEKVTHWLGQLSLEIEERLVKDRENNKRVAKSLTISVRTHGDKNSSTVVSRACPIPTYSASKIAENALKILQKMNSAPANSLLWNPPVLSLALSAGKFEDQIDSSACNIHQYFCSSKTSPQKQEMSNRDESNLLKCRDTQNVAPSSATDCTILNSTEKQVSTNKSQNFFKTSTNKTNSNAENDSILLTNSIQCETESCDSNYDDIESDRNLKILYEEIVEYELPTSKKIVKGFFSKKLEERELAKSLGDSNLPNEISVDSMKPLVGSSINEQSEIVDSNIEVEEKVQGKSEEKSSDSVQFFKPSFSNPGCSTDETDLVILSPDVTFLCEKCQKRVAIWEEQEHSDYHFAKEIQENMIVPKMPNTENKKPSVKVKKKRQSKAEMLKANKKPKQTLTTLDAFFK